MQKNSLVWRGIALLAATCVSTAIVNCGDDDDLSTPTTDAGVDATTPDTGSLSDTGTAEETSTDAGSAAATVRLALVNDMTGQDSALTVCAVATTAAGETAAPGGPLPAAGVAVGKIGDLDLPASFFTAATNVRFAVYYVDTLKSFGLDGKTCAEIIAQSALRAVGDAGTGADAGSKPLLDTVDFETSTSRPTSDFTAGSKFVLLSSGCTKQTKQEYIDIGLCGDTFEKTASSAAVWSYKLDTTTAVPADKSLVQFIHASWGLTDFASVKLQFQPVIRYSAADAGADGGANDLGYGATTGVARGANGGVAFPSPGALVPSLTTALGIGAITDTTTGRSRVEAWDSVFEGTTATTASLKGGARYTTLVIGAPYADPRNSDGTKNFRFAHYAIIPNASE